MSYVVSLFPTGIADCLQCGYLHNILGRFSDAARLHASGLMGEVL